MSFKTTIQTIRERAFTFDRDGVKIFGDFINRFRFVKHPGQSNGAISYPKGAHYAKTIAEQEANWLRVNLRRGGLKKFEIVGTKIYALNKANAERKFALA